MKLHAVLNINKFWVRGVTSVWSIQLGIEKSHLYPLIILISHIVIFHALVFSVTVIIIFVVGEFIMKRSEFEIIGTVHVCIKTNLDSLLEN